MPTKTQPKEFDVESLTIAEMEDLEEASGISIDELFSEGRKARMLRAIAYVVNKRANPTFTWEDAANVKASDALNATA